MLCSTGSQPHNFTSHMRLALLVHIRLPSSAKQVILHALHTHTCEQEVCDLKALLEGSTGV